ncbi:hypothetical protein B0H10DRAFT_1791818 [Mycena sp. CBHHK59/15]|nr:hypothetical protein B0H10DRAFT_1791818 [Mycena sp. CBHHK59/15]
MTTPAPSESPAAHLPDQFTLESAELRAQVSEHTPIRFTASNEPYIPFPAPFEAFRLGVMRQSDIPHDIAMNNDIRVARTLVGPAYPMPIVNVQKWLVRERAICEALFAGYAAGRFRPVDTYPFAIVREVLADGTEAYVGEVTLFYCGDAEKRLSPVNDAWEAWRTRTKVWEIGAALCVEYHGRGIASAAVAVAMNEWAIPQMGATELRAQCFVSNTPSVKLWQKHGFVENPALRGEVKVSEAKGGGVEPDMVLVWYLK